MREAQHRAACLARRRCLRALFIKEASHRACDDSCICARPFGAWRFSLSHIRHFRSGGFEKFSAKRYDTGGLQRRLQNILPGRLTVGLMPLEHGILVRIQARQQSCETDRGLQINTFMRAKVRTSHGHELSPKESGNVRPRLNLHT